MRARLWVPAVAALILYALIWAAWATGSPWVSAVDDAALERAASVASGRPGWVRGWDVFCRLGAPGVLRLLLLFPIGWLLLRRRWGTALFLLVVGEGSALLDMAAKLLANRPRPEDALVPALGSSYPSGHALGTLAIALAVGAVLWPRLGRRGRTLMVAVGALFVVAIGIGRVVLLVHHPSDVVAGWLLGYAFATLCVPLLGPPPQGPRAIPPGDAARSAE